VVSYRSEYRKTCATAKIHAFETPCLTGSSTCKTCLSEAVEVVSAGFACQGRWFAIETLPLRFRRLAGLERSAIVWSHEKRTGPLPSFLLFLIHLSEQISPAVGHTL
jgi:hypothetical protein